MDTNRVKGILLFLLLTIGFHSLFVLLNWPGKLFSFIFLPAIIGLFYFLKSIHLIFNNKGSTAKFSLLIFLNYFLISVKLHYIYYNLLFIVLSIALNLFILIRSKRSLKNPLATTAVFSCGLTFILLFTPDTLLLQYYNSLGNKHKWTKELTWSYFNGQADKNSPYSAIIVTSAYWKINKMYNYPPAISIATIDTDSSWNKPLDNIDHSTYLLKHEQLHFDITEVYRRKAMDSISNLWISDSGSINSIMDYFANKRDSAQTNYDKETDHGTDSVVQSVWNYNISKQF